jgi:DNA polymerase-3 subunit beta
MTLRAKRKELLNAAQFAASVTKTHATTMAVLSHLLIQPQMVGIKLIASNLEVQASHHCECELVEVDDGNMSGFCIPAKLLIDILSLSESEDVEINHADNRATITLGARKLKIATLPAIEMPLFPEVKGDTFELASEVLGTQLGRVSFATSDQESRQILHNVSVAFVKNEFRFVACDGKRGAMTSIPLKGEGEFLMPPILTSIVEKFCSGSDSDVTVTHGENAASFKFKDSEIVGKLFDGRYPNFLNAVPAERPHHCTLDRHALISALKAMELVHAGTFSGVKFEFGPNAVHLTSENPERSGDESVPSSACAMEPIMLPSDQLIEALSHLTLDNVTLEMIGSQSPVVIQEPDYLQIIMPLLLT